MVNIQSPSRFEKRLDAPISWDARSKVFLCLTIDTPCGFRSSVVWKWYFMHSFQLRLSLLNVLRYSFCAGFLPLWYVNKISTTVTSPWKTTKVQCKAACAVSFEFSKQNLDYKYLQQCIGVDNKQLLESLKYPNSFKRHEQCTTQQIFEAVEHVYLMATVNHGFPEAIDFVLELMKLCTWISLINLRRQPNSYNKPHMLEPQCRVTFKRFCSMRLAAADIQSNVFLKCMLCLFWTAASKSHVSHVHGERYVLYIVELLKTRARTTSNVRDCCEFKQAVKSLTLIKYWHHGVYNAVLAQL